MSAGGAVLGVDPGTVRVGVARSDPDRLVATPLAAIAAGADARETAVRLADLALAEGCETVVVGLPLGLSGRDTASTRAARELAAALEALGTVAVALADERLTSVEVDRALERGAAPGRGRRDGGGAQQRAARRRAERERGDRDAMAAALLLQGWLDARRARDAAARSAPGGS